MHLSAVPPSSFSEPMQEIAAFLLKFRPVQPMAGLRMFSTCPAPSVVHNWEKLLVGRSPEMRRLVDLIRMVSPRRATVLITGETGAGKELIARALHLAG